MLFRLYGQAKYSGVAKQSGVTFMGLVQTSFACFEEMFHREALEWNQERQNTLMLTQPQRDRTMPQTENISKPPLVIFDFDGTITYSNAFLRAVLFFVGWRKMAVAAIFLLGPAFGYALKAVSYDKLKEKAMVALFAGMEHARYLCLCESFGRTVIPVMLRPQAMDCLAAHNKAGRRVLVVSASPGEWLEGWAKTQGAELVASAMEEVEGRLTGKMVDPNCRGEEKVRRIEARVGDLGQFHVIAYGDSKGDLALLSKADEGYYKPFRK